jgi:hypothetical protein
VVAGATGGSTARTHQALTPPGSWVQGGEGGLGDVPEAAPGDGHARGGGTLKEELAHPLFLWFVGIRWSQYLPGPAVAVMAGQGGGEHGGDGRGRAGGPGVASRLVRICM